MYFKDKKIQANKTKIDKHNILMEGIRSSQPLTPNPLIKAPVTKILKLVLSHQTGSVTDRYLCHYGSRYLTLSLHMAVSWG